MKRCVWDTSIYPALASLEQKGLVRYHVVEQQAVRPDKKVYELTGEGRRAGVKR